MREVRAVSSFYKDQVESPPHKKKICHLCGWVGTTNLFNCYRREQHEHKKPNPLEEIKE